MRFFSYLPCRLVSMVLVVLWFGVTPVAADGRAQDKVVFLIVESNRLVASNALLGRVDDIKLIAREAIVQKIEAEAVIVVITTQRYIAYGAYAPSWRTLRVRANERLTSVEAKDASASVVTSDRYLNFNGRRGVWAEKKKRL